MADLRYYSQAELCECPYAYEGARRYPVGMLKGNGTLPDIKIHFLHYRSFEEARENGSSAAVVLISTICA